MTCSTKAIAFLGVLVLAGCQASTDSKAADAAAAKAALPTPPPVVIPAGTVFPVLLETDVSSDRSREGDPVVARVREDVRVGEQVVLKQGAELRGRVTSAVPSGKVKGRAHLSFDFDRLVVNGSARPVSVREVDVLAESNKKHDAAVIGGGAGVGAIIGAIADGKKGAAIGGLIGGAAGTGVVLSTEGKEVRLASGTRYRLRLEQELRF